MDQAVLPLQHVACPWARSRPAVRQRARPFQPEAPRAAGQPSENSSASPATRISTISAAITNSPTAACTAEAEILADPRNEWTLADRYATEEMFIVPPEGWDSARYQIEAAPAGRMLEAGDVVDLGDRAFEVIHTPGHSPGGIALHRTRDRRAAFWRHRL